MSKPPLPAQPPAGQARGRETAAAAAPRGAPCPSCGSPLEPHDLFCPACGAPQPEPGPPPPAASPRRFRCDNCGSQAAVNPDQRSYVCPFCDSAYVVEFTPDQTDRQRPEFIVGFSVTPEQAQQQFQKWIACNRWLQPHNLPSLAAADKLRGAYLPFWSFSALAESEWSARIGEHWTRTEIYTTTDSKGNLVTHTRTVQETEWWPLAGRHHRFGRGYLVSASRGLPQQEAERLKPFHTASLKRYQPYYLAGWICEEYSLPRQEALGLWQTEYRRQLQSEIAAFLPGDTHRELHIQTQFRQVSSDLCLLPVYVLSYRYQDKLYRYLVNGQTGKEAGDKPICRRRVAAAVAAVLALLVVLLALLALALYLR